MRLPLTIVGLVVFLVQPGVSAQEAAVLQKQLAELQESQKAMQKDLAEIKALLKTLPRGNAVAQPGLPQTMDASGILVKGDPNAPLTIIEFTDMQCPFCSRFAKETFTQLESEYIQTGKVRYIVKNFPLIVMHRDAFLAAQANHCAAEQQRAWEMHERMFGNQQKLSKADLVAQSAEMGLDSETFRSCLESGKYAAAVRAEMSEAQTAGITGTPAFVLGATEGRKMKPQRLLSGAQALPSFQAAIDSLLEKKPVAGGGL